MNFTVKTAAERLGFSRDTIYGMINRGDLGCIRRPNCAIRIREEHILEYEKRFACPAQSEKKRNTRSLKSRGDVSGMSDTASRAAAEASLEVLVSTSRTA